MMKTLVLLVGCTALATCAGIFTYPPPTRGPEPAESIITEMVSGQRSPNIRVVRYLGSAAMPPLIRALSLRDSPLKRVYLKMRAWLPDAVACRLPEPQSADYIRLNASALAGELGPAARPAIPSLVILLKDDLVDGNAALSLSSIGPQASDVIPALMIAVGEQRPFAATALGQLGAAAWPARSVLVNASRNGPVWQRQEARSALRRIDRLCHRRENSQSPTGSRLPPLRGAA